MRGECMRASQCGESAAGLTGGWWRRWVDWYEYLGKLKPADFMTYDDASACAQKHDIKGVEDYRSRYKQINADLPPDHKQLPSNPARDYKDQG